MHKLRQYIHKSYRRQLQLYFIIASVIPLSVSGFLLVAMFRRQAGRDLARQDLKERDQIETTLLDYFSLVEESIREVEDDPDIKAALTDGRVVSSNVYAALYRETGTVRDFASVDIYSGGKRIYSTDSGNEARTLPTDFGILARAAEHPEQVVYEAAIDTAGGSGRLSGGAGSSGTAAAAGTSAAGDNLCLQIARQINDNNGFALVTIRQESLDALLQGSYRGDEGILLLNRFYEKIYGTGALAVDETAGLLRGNLLAGRTVTQGLDSNYYASRLGSTGLILLYLTPPALSARIFRSMMTVVVVFALIAALLSLFFSSYMSAYLTRPIAALDEGMKRFRHGDMNAHVDLERDDEIGQLAEGFNKTTIRIRENMEEQLAQQKRLNETEIAMMQAQLNPHFLYNTLDTIKWVAKAHDVPEVAQLAQNLGKLLRKSISGAQFIPLSEELDIVESYCSIQEFRFDHTFSYECEVPQELMRCLVPKLILQPVVENAIIHGLEGVEDGLVKVTARRAAGNGKQQAPLRQDLEIIVTDNGRGISDEMIEVLQEHNAEKLSGHLGFRNVDTILRMFYGDDYGVSAARLPGGGTLVRLLLPLQEKMQKEDEDG